MFGIYVIISLLRITSICFTCGMKMSHSCLRAYISVLAMYVAQFITIIIIKYDAL